MKKITIGILSLFCLLSNALYGQEDLQIPTIEASINGEIKEIQLTLPRPNPDFPGNLLWHDYLSLNPTEYLRFYVERIEACEEQLFSLSLMNKDGDVFRKYSSEEITKRTPFWTSLIAGEFAKIEMSGTEAQPNCKVMISKVAYKTESGKILSTYGDDEKEDIVVYEEDPVISQLAKSVAYLHFIRDGKPRECTGFIIGGNKLMTNEHCIHTQKVCDTAIATFGYEYDRNGALRSFDQYECDSLAIGDVDYQLDYAVFTLKGDPQSKWGHLELSDRDPEVKPEGGENLFVIQHPAGEPKQISKKNCNAMKLPVEGRKEFADFTHTCDTVGGSSGSPVIDLNGQVVGLHHFGFKADSVWTENRAVRMKMITQHMEAQNESVQESDQE